MRCAKTGNLAAHDPTATFTKSDARDLVGFTEAVLEYAVVLSERFQAFRSDALSVTRR